MNAMAANISIVVRNGSARDGFSIGVLTKVFLNRSAAKPGGDPAMCRRDNAYDVFMVDEQSLCRGREDHSRTEAEGSAGISRPLHGMARPGPEYVDTKGFKNPLDLPVYRSDGSRILLRSDVLGAWAGDSRGTGGRSSSDGAGVMVFGALISDRSNEEIPRIRASSGILQVNDRDRTGWQQSP
jgi:hypothetical protein